MTEYLFKLKFSNLQFNNWKSGIKNDTQVTLKLNVAGDSND